MALKLSRELMHDSLSKHLLEGETIEAMVYGQKLNLLITLLTKYYFLGLTNKRLLIMRVTPFYKEKDFKAVNLEDIKGFKTSGSINGKNLTVEGKEGKVFDASIPSVIVGLKDNKEDFNKIINILQGLNIYAV